MKSYDVVALGELLIDFTESGSSAQGNPLLEANPGGAPCNVLAMLAKLGRKSAFIGKVGKDAFGQQLKEAAAASGIDVSCVSEDAHVPTTLAFVHTKPDGDREFSFYRNPGADVMLTKEEICPEMVKNTRIFHFGTLSSVCEPVKSATRYAIQLAKESGALLSFDPNLREALWDDLEQAREEIEYGLGLCDVLKISDNEIEFLTGTSDYDKGVALLRQRFLLPLVFVTMGKEGSRAYYKESIVSCPPFLQEGTIETTGAGDTFCACALHFILQNGIDMTEKQLMELLRFANAGASLITTRKGALRVMPTREEIEALLAGAMQTEVTLKEACLSQPAIVGEAAGMSQTMVVGEAAGMSQPAVAGEASEVTVNEDVIIKLECNIDDSTGEMLGYVMERLFAEGAKDVHYTPVFMKKNRPAYLLSVLCAPEKQQAMEEILFLETTTIGIRCQTMQRSVLPRKQEMRTTSLGTVEVKVLTHTDGTCYAPEYESVAKIAREKGLPFREGMEQIRKEL